jgi:hypothetical protein
MRKALRFRSWLETGMASVTAILSVVTLIWRNWIELVFNVELDAGTGSLEWLIVGVLFIATLALSALARNEWRIARAAA